MKDVRARDLERALRIASIAHMGQFDKGDEPYILHPIRVMLAVGVPAAPAALLHDVLEDSSIGMDVLRTEGFNLMTLKAVELLTRPGTPGVGPPERMSHVAYIERIANAPTSSGAIAREVKVADLRDNLRPGGLTEGLERRYRTGLRILGAE